MQLTKTNIQAILNNAPQNADKAKILDSLVAKGYELEGVDMNLARERVKAIQPQKKQTVIGEAIGDVVGIGKDIISSAKNRAGNIQEAKTAGRSDQQSDLRSIGQIAGQLAGAGADAIAAVGKGAVNLFLSDDTEKQITSFFGEKAQQVLSNPKAQEVLQRYEALPEANKRDLSAVGGVAALLSEFAGTGAATKAGSKAANVATDVLDAGVGGAGGVVGGAGGIIQTGKEFASRVPRALGRGKEKIVEAGIRAEKIKIATPAVKKAITSNLDDRIINTVTEADDATREAYKQVLDIAEETPKTIGSKKQPSLVGGELAVKQYDLINKQKRAVGEKIGEITKNLSKTEKLSMQDSFKQMDDILSNQGIVPQYTKKGVRLDFTGSKYTPAERTKIQELYNLATEGGDNLSPAQIKSKDQLFSKLKRESNFEGVGDLIIETPEGNKSLFNVFRDIYSSKLDTISPEIKNLNSSYRNLSQITDDIEDSIFKTPNFNVTKSVDPAEFAKVNMRRIFGEAQSSPVFEAVADVMDKASRGLGYKGATPKQVAEFAEYLRKLYPESVPKTGFQGGIKAGVSDIIESVSKMGTPDLNDQRNALKELLEDYLQSSKKITKPKTKPKTPISEVKSQIANKKIIK